MVEGVVTFNLLNRLPYVRLTDTVFFIDLNVFFWGYLRFQEILEGLRLRFVFSS